MLDGASIVQVLDLHGYILVARGFGDGDVLNCFDLEDSGFARHNRRFLFVSVGNGLACKLRGKVNWIAW